MRFAVICSGASKPRGSRGMGTTTPTAAASPSARGIATAAQLTPSIESLSSTATAMSDVRPVRRQNRQAWARLAHDGRAAGLGR
jgi:hypothetical protein